MLIGKNLKNESDNLIVNDIYAKHIINSNINVNLVKSQNLKLKELSQILTLHSEREDIFSNMKVEEDREKLKELSKTLTPLEFKLQKLWGFTEDEKFHLWFLVPQCSCPRLDNMDLVGFDRNVINMSCLIHGK